MKCGKTVASYTEKINNYVPYGYSKREKDLKMKHHEKQKMRFRYAPEKNIGIAFIDLLLVVAGFLLTAVILGGTWHLSATEMTGVALSGIFAVLFFWGFEMYSAILLKPQPILVTAILSAI